MGDKIDCKQAAYPLIKRYRTASLSGLQLQITPEMARATAEILQVLATDVDLLHENARLRRRLVPMMVFASWAGGFLCHAALQVSA